MFIVTCCSFSLLKHIVQNILGTNNLINFSIIFEYTCKRLNSINFSETPAVTVSQTSPTPKCKHPIVSLIFSLFCTIAFRKFLHTCKNYVIILGERRERKRREREIKCMKKRVKK